MLAVRASAACHASRIRLARPFATVVDSAGFKVAAVDNGQPTTSVTFLVNAGSRFEPKPGVAHALKNFAFKSTEKRSALGTVRESEIYGGVLSTSLSREHLALTAEFMRGDESFFVDVLSSFVTSAKFTRHEFEEYVLPVVVDESTAAGSNPTTRALELAHTVAFRTGLGSPLFANPHHSTVTSEDVKSFAHSVFTKGNVAVLGTGISQDTLSKLVETSVGSASSPLTSVKPSTPSSSYFGGETRVEAHGGPQTIFIGFGTAGTPTPELSVLSTYLSPQPSIKWSRGLSPLSAAIPSGTSVRTVLFPYSDATLFGLLLQGSTVEGVKEAGKAVVKAVKASAPSGGVSVGDLKKAVAKAKFEAASSVDGREGMVSVLGSKVLAGSKTSLDSILASLDNVTVASFSKTTSGLIKGKRTYIAVGDVCGLPYADELGFE